MVIGDEALVDEVIQSVEASITREPRDATVVIEGTEARIEPAEVGLAVQRTIVVDDMLRCFGCEDRRIAVAVEFVPVQVTEEDAQQALADAQKMMSGSVTVTYEDESWEFDPDEIAEWIDFRPVPVDDTTATVHSIDCTDSLECTGGVCLDASGTVQPHRMMLEAFISANEASKTVTLTRRRGRLARAGRVVQGGGGAVDDRPAQGRDRTGCRGACHVDDDRASRRRRASRGAADDTGRARDHDRGRQGRWASRSASRRTRPRTRRATSRA